MLATVLFTDIVGSTKIATEMGDVRWRELVSRSMRSRKWWEFRSTWGGLVAADEKNDSLWAAVIPTQPFH